MVTAFVSLHFHTLFVFTAFTFLITHSCTIFISFTRLESQFYSLISSVAFNVIVTSAHLHRHSTHRHYHFIDHHFFCSLLLSPPLPLNMPVRGLYGHGKGSYGHGHGKGSYGHGLAHTLPVPALCGHGKGVSALAGLIFFFFFCLFV